MNDDLRCCGSGTCLINAEGVCWCGQRWDGEKMCGSDSQHQAENTDVEALQPRLDCAFKSVKLIE